MMRALITAAAALLLAACAQVQNQAAAPVSLQSSSAVKPRIEAVATLATNACEAQTAPLYTANIVIRRQASRLLDQSKLTAVQGAAVLGATDAARASLDAACGANNQPTAAHISDAREHLQRAWSIIKGVQ